MKPRLKNDEVMETDEKLPKDIFSGIRYHGSSSSINWGIPTQQKSHTAENENSVPSSRIFLYAAI